MAVTCAIPAYKFACGWKKILTTAMPFMDCDSMCSILFTVVVSARSVIYTMRSDMSWGEKPVYCQTTLTTGMSILGKISVGVLEITTGARMNNINDRTTKVYGRRNARRTIHIDL